MRKKLRVAVIGAGNMGRHHVRNYASLEGFELCAVADANPDAKMLAKEFGANFFPDYIKMFDEIKPEAISIAVPTPLHYEIAHIAISRGIHVLLEKPIASTLDQADKLIKLAEEKNIVFTVGHIERYNPVVRKLKGLIDAGKIGEVTSVVSIRVGGFPRIEPKTDVIADLAIHDIDIINYLVGSHPRSVYSHGSITAHSSKYDSGEILMDYGHASGFIQANWITPVKVRTIAVTGTDGYIQGNYITQELVYYVHNITREKLGPKFESFVSAVGEPKKQQVQVHFKEPLAAELEAFQAAIAYGIKQAIVDPRDAREALRIALVAAHHDTKTAIAK